MKEPHELHRNRPPGTVATDIPLAGLIELKALLANYDLDNLDRDSGVRLMGQLRALGFDPAPGTVDIHV